MRVGTFLESRYSFEGWRLRWAVVMGGSYVRSMRLQLSRLGTCVPRKGHTARLGNKIRGCVVVAVVADCQMD